ncbi:hypothetical protein HK102_007645, partial [Quaeritorhiza haematococci]
DAEIADLDVAQTAEDIQEGEDVGADEASVSDLKGGWGYGYGGYPFFGGKRGFGGFGKKGFGRKRLPYGGLFGKKDAEIADLEMAQAEDVELEEGANFDADEASVSDLKGGWGYGYGGYPFFGGKKGFGGYGKKGFGKKRFGKKGWY